MCPRAHLAFVHENVKWVRVDYDLEEGLVALRRLNDEARNLREQGRTREPGEYARYLALLDQRDELIVAVLENLSVPITLTQLARALRLSTARMSQIVARTRERLNAL